MTSRAAVSIFVLYLFASLLEAAPTTQPTRDALARARAEAERMVQPSGPLRAAAAVAFDPVPAPRQTSLTLSYEKYVYSTPTYWTPYCGYGGYGGFGCGWGYGGSGIFFAPYSGW